MPVFESASLSTSVKITIIIPARNEATNIQNCIDSILKQTYEEDFFEIIVVDDFSTDNTAALVKSYQKKNVHLIQLKDYVTAPINSYKKKAIEIGIEHAKGELIVTTDADCIVPSTWLATMASFYEEKNAAFIAMPVRYTVHKNNFLHIFQALDFMVLQGITGAAVYKKFHSMCNGANLAYSKQAFYEVDGFKGVDAIASGDDMLLMHKIFKKYPSDVHFLKSDRVIVQTTPMETLRGFINQRIRWASKSDKYDDKRIMGVLIWVYIFNLFLFFLPIASLLFNFQYSMFTFHFSLFTFWMLIVILKTFIELFFLYPVAKFFGQQKLLWWFPLAQPFHILYTVIAGWLGKFGSYRWKERRVK